jgi:hypothetical protein
MRKDEIAKKNIGVTFDFIRAAVADLNLMHSSKVRISHFYVCKYMNSLTANF